MNLLATLGDFNDAGKGRVVKIDLISEESYEIINYDPPDHLKIPGKGFTGACWLITEGGVDFLICGFAAIYRFNPKNWELKGIYHQPSFNDLHHISIYNNRIYIVNTGFDRIEVYDINFNYLGGYNLEPIWVSCKRYYGINPTRKSWEDAFRIRHTGINSRIIDDGPPRGEYYTSNKNLKEFHQQKKIDFIHPNHISFLDDNILITRFNDRTIQNLKDWQIIIKDIPGFPHDGKVFDNLFWITCTNGFILGYDIYDNIPSGKIVEKINIFNHTSHIGWLRGLLIKKDLFIVALTKITRMPCYRWCDLPYDKTETSVLAIDRETYKLVYHIDLSKFGSHPKVFELIEL